MVVGEPSLMGGELGDDDERLITRLENHQYDGTSIDNENHFHADNSPSHNLSMQNFPQNNSQEDKKLISSPTN